MSEPKPNCQHCNDTKLVPYYGGVKIPCPLCTISLHCIHGIRKDWCEECKTMNEQQINPCKVCGKEPQFYSSPYGYGERYMCKTCLLTDIGMLDGKERARKAWNACNPLPLQQQNEGGDVPVTVESVLQYFNQQYPASEGHIPLRRMLEQLAGTGKQPDVSNKKQVGTVFKHPTTIDEFVLIYRTEYEQELDSCDRWIKWCEEQKDTHGMNFHQGMRAAHVFNNIKMGQLIRILKQEKPNAK